MSAGDTLPRGGHGAGRRKLGGIFVILFVVGFGSRKLVLLSTFDSPGGGVIWLSCYLCSISCFPTPAHLAASFTDLHTALIQILIIEYDENQNEGAQGHLKRSEH